MTKQQLAATELVTNAVCAEDVFGMLKGEIPEIITALKLDSQASLTHLKVEYRKLAVLLHPDKGGSDEAFAKLETWHTQAQAKIAEGTYGTRASARLKIKNKTFDLGRNIAPGDLTQVYRAREGANKVILKITRTPANNDLVRNEATRLAWLRKESPSKDMKMMQHISELVNSFEIQDGKIKRQVNVLKYYEDFYTLTEVMAAYPKGIDIKDAVWMFNRMLAALIVAHSSKLVHGAFLPEHFMIRPVDHNGVLIDWSYSVPFNDKLKAAVPSRKDFYPPEVFNKYPATPGLDLAMAATCFQRLLGANWDTAPRAITGFMRACTLGPKHRPQDAWEVHKEFGELLRNLWGPRHFHVFTMPPAWYDELG